MPQIESGPIPAGTGKADPTVRRRLIGALVVIGLYLAVQLAPRPIAIKPEGWRLLGIFVATIGGLILQPIAIGALVLIAVTLAAIIGGLTLQQALEGYGDPTVWLVMAAFFISIAMIKTGFARRLALIFVRAFGKSSLGVSYALSLTDLLLAGIIPSNGARSGGVVLPIARSIAELYGSRPGATAHLLGSFLMISVYQNICVTAAMFMTGQASNPLAAKIAVDTFHFPMTWTLWALAGLVPGLCSLAFIPYLIYRLDPPGIRNTPEAAAFAGAELARMGRMDRAERIVLVIFAAVCGLWITSPWHRLEIALPALLGVCALLATGILRWEEVLQERGAWDIFIWYGGMVRLGRALNDAGVTREFAKAVGGLFPGSSWVALFAFALLIYFYTHYGFASITAHLLAMFVPFVILLTAKGAPLGLTIFAFACFTNFAAGLTHYGTTPSPMFYSTGYVSFQKWWKAGFIASLANIAIWSTIGFAWWKLIGLW
jgi:DASS family divalent anion:Na+ symporter